MAERRPLVIKDGKIAEIPIGDTLPSAVVSGGSTNFDSILTDQFSQVLVDNNGNVLTE